MTWCFTVLLSIMLLRFVPLCEAIPLILVHGPLFHMSLDLITRERENQLVKCVLNTMLVISLICLQRWKAQTIQNVT